MTFCKSSFSNENCQGDVAACSPIQKKNIKKYLNIQKISGIFSFKIALEILFIGL